MCILVHDGGGRGGDGGCKVSIQYLSRRRKETLKFLLSVTNDFYFAFLRYIFKIPVIGKYAKKKKK